MDYIEQTRNSLGISRDDAFNAMCAVGLESHLALLFEDHLAAAEALVRIERIESDRDFGDLLRDLTLLNSDYETKLGSLFLGMKDDLNKQLSAKKLVIDHAQKRIDALPLFIARVLS